MKAMPRWGTIAAMNARRIVLTVSLIMLGGTACAELPGVLAYRLDGGEGEVYVPLQTVALEAGARLIEDEPSGRVVIEKNGRRVFLCVGMALICSETDSLQLEHAVKRDAAGVSIPMKAAGWLKRFFASAVERPPHPTKARSPHKVVIDAGHGGKDPGAIGKNGLKEKIITLAIARRVARRLRVKGVHVVMTRTRDVFIPLDRRVAITNAEEPDLFVSIHANICPSNRYTTGVEVYYPRESLGDVGRAERIAPRLRELQGVRFGRGDRYLALALCSTLLETSRRVSVTVARKVCRSISDATDTPYRGIRGAGFRVLKSALCPAILVEVDYLSNPRMERKFRSSSYLDKVANAIVEGILEGYAAANGS